MQLSKGYTIDSAAREWAVRTFLFVNIAVLTGLLILIYFPFSQYRFYPACPWYALTHTYCPGCGTLRGINHMLHGDILGLIKSNKMAVIFVPILVWEYVHVGVQGLRGYKLPELVLSKFEVYLLLALIIVYWVARKYIRFLAPY